METDSNLQELTDEQMTSLMEQMKQNNLVKDRAYFFKKYPKCFVGSEAVVFFLTTNYCTTIGDAIALGQQLMDADFFHHVTDDHVFKNEDLYYRFRVDEEKYGKKPSVAKLLKEGNVSIHGELTIKSTLFWNRRYFVLRADKKKIYYFQSNLSSNPTGIIELSEGALEAAECECKSGSYCFTLTDGKRKWVLCAENSKTQLAWLEALTAIGVTFREEEIDVGGVKSIFDYTVNDIDGNVVSLDRYRGNVCIVVNIASY
jgi:hypothetical protein